MLNFSKKLIIIIVLLQFISMSMVLYLSQNSINNPSMLFLILLSLILFILIVKKNLYNKSRGILIIMSIVFSISFIVCFNIVGFTMFPGIVKDSAFLSLAHLKNMGVFFFMMLLAHLIILFSIKLCFKNNLG